MTSTYKCVILFSNFVDFYSKFNTDFVISTPGFQPKICFEVALCYSSIRIMVMVCSVSEFQLLLCLLWMKCCRSSFWKRGRGITFFDFVAFVPGQSQHLNYWEITVFSSKYISFLFFVLCRQCHKIIFPALIITRKSLHGNLAARLTPSRGSIVRCPVQNMAITSSKNIVPSLATAESLVSNSVDQAKCILMTFFDQRSIEMARPNNFSVPSVWSDFGRVL